MVTYDILQAEDLEGLRYLVNTALEAGWDIQGGLVLAVAGKKTVYAQAVTKKKERQSFLN
jgi:hypothetical protein